MKKLLGCFDLKADISLLLNPLPEGLITYNNFACTIACNQAFTEEFRIILAGNIFNSQSLVRQFSLKASGTAEIALNLFILKGSDWISYVDGDFTAIIFNHKELYIFRDRHGSGPQIYFTNKYFASLMPDLLKYRDFIP